MKKRKYTRSGMKEIKNETPTTYGDFILFLPMLSDECAKKDLDILNNAPKPDYICGRDIPDFNTLTFGQYSDLCDAMGNEDKAVAMVEMIKAIFPNDVMEDEINEAPAYDVWGFCSFAAKEADRINKVFGSIKFDKTPEEKQAGIDKLQFGTFGILDWYARRMKITDQNEVYSVKWVRIYQCMANDTEEAAYNRRLQAVYSNNARKRNKVR